MKPPSQRMTISQILRIIGILGVVLLFLIACAVGTVFVAVIIGLVFSKFFP